MSILYNTYVKLKKEDANTVYLFKSGIFYIALNRDAMLLSSTFNLKLSNLNDTVVKCGFPCNSLHKYSVLFRGYNIPVKIITPETHTLYSLTEYVQDQEINELLKFICSINIDNTSVSEAYDTLERLKRKAEKIMNS